MKTRKLKPQPGDALTDRQAAARQRRLDKIEYDFHVRAFGEEIARINFLPPDEMKRAVGEMIDHARRKGVKLTRPALGVTI
jgi:hypothetical protein